MNQVMQLQPVVSNTSKQEIRNHVFTTRDIHVTSRHHVASRARLIATLYAGLTWLVMPESASAAGSNMPWEAPLQSILDSIQGPVAKIVAVIIIITTGLTLAFGETAGGFRRLIQIVFGLSIAFAASSFFLSFFSFGGGALIS